MRPVPSDLNPDVDEKLLCAATLRDSKTAAHVDISWYHNQAYAEITSIAQKLWPKGNVDITEVARRASDKTTKAIGGATGFSVLYDMGFPQSSDLLIETVRSMYDRRRVWAAAYRAQSDAANIVVPLRDITAELAESIRLHNHKPEETNLDSLVRLTEIAEGRVPRGHPIKLASLQHYLGGWVPGRMYVIAGRPGMGKTQLAIDIAADACRTIPVLFVSLEMDRDEIMLRTVANVGRLSQSRIQSGTVDMDAFTTTCEQVASMPLSIVDSGVRRISDVERVAYSSEAKLIIVDYLQLLKGKGRNRENEVADISRSIKAIARELRVPVLALCQLSRKVEERSDKRPLLSDLRESGSIEQDADVVLMLYRDGYYTEDPDNKTLEIIVRKNRHGMGTGIATCLFDFDKCSAYDVERRMP